VNGITFESNPLTFASATGQGTFFTGDGGATGNSDLDRVLDSHGWSGGATAIPIPSLTVGQRYQVQLIGAADRRGCCATRNQAIDDGAGHVSGDMSRMGPGSVIGRFIADSTTQVINVVPGTVNGVDPGLSAGIVSILPPAKSVSINFGAEEPGGAGSSVTGAAGVLGSSVWNNLTGNNGTKSNLVDDAGLNSGVSVSWTSNNTWASQGRGEENNTAPAGNDRNLMTGYLDTNATQAATVSVDGVPFDGPYNVYVYTKGGVNGRGGDYTIGGQTISHVDTAAFDGNYKYGSEGDVLVFSGVTGSTFSLTAQPTTGAVPRAPVNAIEISPILVPEPSSMILAALGLLGALAWRRRR
jgi:hypothetical protein